MNHLIDNVLRQLTFDPANPMLFSCGLFWVLFLVFLPVYAMLKHRRTQMMIFVLAFSLYFYYKSSGWFFILLVCTSLCDWLLSHAIARSTVPRTRRLLTALSITLSLSVLGYFKYANFIVWNWSAIVGSNFQPLDIILPVGISFYTFQSISYVVDVYKQRIAPTQSWLEYAFYLSFFPQLVAGPIVRADYFLPQLRDNRPATREMTYSGLWLVMVGIVKKAIIADYIAQYNDLIFSNPGGYGGLETLMGIAGYTMQIYCDFSGYSDMAIGISLILGFRLSENFRLPYQSKNITEFWRRWHISLSSWLRDYIYIPLGGNRHGRTRTYLNNLATMLLGGLWHGAAWKFVFWGGMHGVGLMTHKALKPWLDRVPDSCLTRFASRAVTIAFVSLLWVFFRADSFGDAATIIACAFTTFDASHIAPFIAERGTWCVMMVVIISLHCVPMEWLERASRWFVGTPWAVKLLLFIAVVQLTLQFMSAEVKPFIYFQF
ncbi:MAG: MBOAT family protein [Bacteroidales bacterium]|nr:MBOAT family protein [Bacteroidales bacterium]